MNGDLDVPDATRATLERGLGTQYRILRLLGRGGMGAVYLARDEALERLVAIKVLSADLAPTAEGRERFRREARTAAQLSHPNVVPLLSFGEVEGLMYLVMGYVQGEPLSARLKRDGRLQCDEVRRVVADVAEALDYAHRKGVVHRDVKPDNVLVDDESGRAVLTDFGIAKALAGGQTVTRLGGIVGTPHYMSPEQAAGHETIDGRSDIYSLGVAAYAMLAGRLPFEGGTPRDVLLRRLSAEAPALAEVVPDVEEDLAAAVTRCLRRDPTDRWPDARALREAVSPSEREADQLPEPLDTLDGKGTFLLPFGLALAGALLALFTSVATEPVAGPALAVALFGGLIVGQLPMLWSAVRVARARGFLWRQVSGALWRQPEWWVCLWYPRRFRRAGDVWERLPRPFRAWRIIVAAMVAVFLLLVGLGTVLLSSLGRQRDLVAYKLFGEPALVVLRAIQALSDGIRLPQLLVAVFLLLGAALGVSAVLCARLMRRQGFDTYTLRRVSHALVTASTSRRAPWKKPEVAQVLLPAPSSPRPSEPRGARELLASLVQAVRALPATVRTAAEGAATGAAALAEAIEREEAAIARLARHADPDEAARLRERLAATDASEDPESGPMRELMARQLALLEDMAGRLALAQSHRERLLGNLREAWRAVVELAGNPSDPEALRRLGAVAETVQPGRATPTQATATRER